MTVTWKKIAYRADVLPDLLSPYAVGDLIYAPTTTTLGKLADAAVGKYLRSGASIGGPAWATLNQAAVAGLATTDGPTFAHLHLADVAAIYTAAESWIGPSAEAGIYFKAGNYGFGTATPNFNTGAYANKSFHLHNTGTDGAGTSTTGIHITNGTTGDTAAHGLILARWYTGTNYLFTYENESLSLGTNGVPDRLVILGSGLISMSYYGAGTATFDASGNISSISDERLKTIVGKYTGGIAQLNGIEPIVHKWNEKSGMEMDHEYVGFSAQNVQDNMPEAVYENKDGYLSYSDKAVIAALVNAVKAQQAQIEAMQAKQK